MKAQTSLHSEDLKLIKDAVCQLAVPKSFLFRRIFKNQSSEVEKKRSDIRRDIEKHLEEAQRALDEILDYERGKPQKPSGSFLKQIQSRGSDQ